MKIKSLRFQSYLLFSAGMSFMLAENIDHNGASKLNQHEEKASETRVKPQPYSLSLQLHSIKLQTLLSIRFYQ